jgi:predicted amidohydrolase
VRLRVAGAQMPVTLRVQDNARALLRVIAAAAGRGAQVLVTPEGSLSGYTHAFDQADVEEALEEVRRAAAARGLGLALGTCFTEPDGKVYDELRFYDAAGVLLGFHGKTLTCGTLEKHPRGEIERFAVPALRTFLLNGVRCGGLVCNDLWANPGYTPGPDTHLSQQLAAAGARVVFHAVNGDRDGSPWSTVTTWSYHESNLQMRARAGGLYIVTCDNCFPPDVPCSSPSGVVGPDGTWLVRAPRQGEHVFSLELEIPA